MGSWTLYGILLSVGLFFVLVGIVMASLQVTNPLTGGESTIWGLIWDWISPL